MTESMQRASDAGGTFGRERVFENVGGIVGENRVRLSDTERIHVPDHVDSSCEGIAVNCFIVDAYETSVEPVVKLGHGPKPTPPLSEVNGITKGLMSDSGGGAEKRPNEDGAFVVGSVGINDFRVFEELGEIIAKDVGRAKLHIIPMIAAGVQPGEEVVVVRVQGLYPL